MFPARRVRGIFWPTLMLVGSNPELKESVEKSDAQLRDVASSVGHQDHHGPRQSWLAQSHPHRTDLCLQRRARRRARQRNLFHRVRHPIAGPWKPPTQSCSGRPSRGGCSRQLYELSQRTLFSPSELRRLTADYETIRRSCAVRLAVLFRTEFELKLAALTTPTFRQFSGQMAQPTHLTLFKVEPLRGIGVLEMSPPLALNLLDRLMGGPGTASAETRDLTEIEIALLGQVTHLLTEAWCAHWYGWKELKSRADRARKRPALSANIRAGKARCSWRRLKRRSASVSARSGSRCRSPLWAAAAKIRAELKPPVEAPTSRPSLPSRRLGIPRLDHVNIPISAELPAPRSPRACCNP